MVWMKWRAYFSLRIRHIRRRAAALSTIALVAAVLGGTGDRVDADGGGCDVRLVRRHRPGNGTG